MKSNKCQYDAECLEPAYRVHVLDCKGWLCETHRVQGKFKKVEGEPEDYYEKWGKETMDLPKKTFPLNLAVYASEGSKLRKDLFELEKESMVP